MTNNQNNNLDISTFDNHLNNDYLLEQVQPDYSSMLPRLTCTFVLSNNNGSCRCMGCYKQNVLIICKDCLNVLQKRKQIVEKLKGV